MTDTLARAFERDPVQQYMFGDLPDQPDRTRALMRLGLTRLTMPNDEVYTLGDNDGVALWLPPGKGRTSTLEALQLLPSMIRIAGLRRLPRILSIFNSFESKHPHEDHFYLMALAVKPEMQGRGIGTALLRPMLERLDRERMPAYLESSHPRNVPLYERHGFRVTETIELPAGGPRVSLMWREPSQAERPTSPDVTDLQ